jgi:hypothetical protein
VNPLDWSLTTGWFPIAITAVGLAALLVLCSSTDRRWYTRRGPLLVLAALLVLLLGVFAVEHLWQPFPDLLPAGVIGWAGLVPLGLALALGRMRGLRWPGRLGLFGCAVLVALAALVGINSYYDTYRTLGAALSASYADPPS